MLRVRGRPRFSSTSQRPLWCHHAGAIGSDSATQRWSRGEHGGESKRQSKTYVGFEASAWSVCSFSPPSTSMVQYTIRLGASDFRPCTSMMTTCGAKKEECKRSCLLQTSLWLLNLRGQPVLGSSTGCWTFLVAGRQGWWHMPMLSRDRGSHRGLYGDREVSLWLYMGLLKPLGAQGCTKLQEMGLTDVFPPHLKVPLYMKSRKKAHSCSVCAKSLFSRLIIEWFGFDL